ncbi:MAG: sensor histidine kinase [Nocardiopsaceae bacterium]|nr:sensor histidine kinase [Nocardiopsaceae bacterium]
MAVQWGSRVWGKLADSLQPAGQRDGQPQARPVRSQLAADSALALVLAVVLTVATYFVSQREANARPFDAGAALLVIAAAAALAARRRWPVAVLAVEFAILLSYLATGYPDGPIWLALIIAYFTAVVSGHRLAGVAGAIAVFGMFGLIHPLLGRGQALSPVELAGVAAWPLVLLGAAEAVRVRRVRAAEAAKIREEEALRRASEERLRIARELHDSLGHYLSMISVQSGVALNLNHDLPGPVAESLSAIRQASKEGLRELRSVLRILRQDGEPAPHAPPPALAQLDDLLNHAAAAGLQVRAETGGAVRELPFGVGQAAFRIVQEALTNVTRHAGTATATVRVRYGQRDLTVQVDDDGRGCNDGPAPAGGSGIAGMRDRAAALGGELHAGPSPGGGFRVTATLPLAGSQ